MIYIKAQLILENGTIFQGEGFGAVGARIGCLIVNTRMTGYTEALTKPSQAGNIVVFSYPLIGNSGVCTQDFESPSITASSLVISELSTIESNFRSEASLTAVLEKHGVPGIKGIDTRALVRLLHVTGSMRAMVVHGVLAPAFESICFDEAPKISPIAKKEVPAENPKKHIAALNFGAKRSTLEKLNGRGISVTLHPYDTDSETILASKPDGVYLTEGAYKAENYPSVLKTIKTIYDSGVPILALGLGHCLLASALGGAVKPLAHGHHGANHPVKDVSTGRVYITAQDFDEHVEALPNGCVAAYINVNDKTVAGFTDDTVISTAFIPDNAEAAIGTGYIFEKYLERIGG